MRTNKLQQGRAKAAQLDAIAVAYHADRVAFERREREARALRRENQRRALAAGGAA